MKATIKYVTGCLLAAAITLLAQSCQKHLTSLNTNPNSLPDTRPEYLFTNYTANFNLSGRQDLINRYTYLQYMQYIVPDGGADANSYWKPGQTTGGPVPPFAFYNTYFNTIGFGMQRTIEKIDAMPAGEKDTYDNLKAICQIVKTYEAWRISDAVGAIPYKQAFDDVQYPLPIYDFEQTLYKTFDSTLKVAATTLKADKANQVDLGQQDFFYGGDIQRWQNFANTLRIKIAQRYEKRDAANLATVLNDIHSNFSDSIISSNDGSFGYTQPRGWNSNVDDINNLFINYNASYAFVAFLRSTRDPRLPLMVRQNDWGDNAVKYTRVKQNGTAASIATLDSVSQQDPSRYFGGHAFPAANANTAYGWEGLPRSHSFPLSTAVNGSTTTTLDYLSRIQTRIFLKNGGFGGFNNQPGDVIHTDEIYSQNTDAVFMRPLYLTYAETCFMMAEIAAKGGNGLGFSAAQWYDKGVKASFDEYKTVGIQTAVPKADTCQLGDYLTRYPYNGLASIYSQAWVEFLANPEEAWAMWKRTGYPQFSTFNPSGANQIGDGSGTAYLEKLQSTSNEALTIPRRAGFVIGSTGANLNENNFNAALQTMISQNPDYGIDGKATYGRTWWDKK